MRALVSRFIAMELFLALPAGLVFGNSKGLLPATVPRVPQLVLSGTE